MLGASCGRNDDPCFGRMNLARSELGIALLLVIALALPWVGQVAGLHSTAPAFAQSPLSPLSPLTYLPIIGGNTTSAP